MELAPVDPNL